MQNAILSIPDVSERHSPPRAEAGQTCVIRTCLHHTSRPASSGENVMEEGSALQPPSKHVGCTVARAGVSGDGGWSPSCEPHVGVWLQPHTWRATGLFWVIHPGPPCGLSLVPALLPPPEVSENKAGHLALTRWWLPGIREIEHMM